MNEQLKQRILSKPHRFAMLISKESLEKANAETKTIPMTFAAPAYIPRWYGILVLNFKPECIRMDRWKQGAPYCMDHDVYDQRGIIRNGRLEDNQLKGDVQFSRNQKGQELFNDVVDGIRPYTSVGFDMHEMHEIPVEEMTEELKTMCIENECKAYGSNDWEPLEGTSAYLGANPGVGVQYGYFDGEKPEEITSLIEQFGIEKFNPSSISPSLGGGQGEAKSKSNHQITIKKEDKMSEAIEKTPEQLAEERRKKQEKFEKIGAKFETRVGGKEVVNTIIQDCLELDQDEKVFKGRLFTKIKDSEPIEQPPSLLGLNDKDKKRYNILSAIRRMIDGKDYGGFEAELSQEISKRVADDETGQLVGEPAHGGLHLPYDIRKRKVSFQEELSVLCNRFGIRNNFDLNVGTATAGGNLVGTDIRPQDFVEYLYNQLIQGFTYLRGLKGNIEIPKMTGGATIYSAATEGAAPTESAPTFSQIEMSPKEVSGYVDMTRKLVVQSSIDVQNLVAMDLFKQLALKMNYLALFGSGSSGEPTGIFNTSGIGTFTGAAITWQQLLEARSDIGSANIVGELTWLMNAVAEVLLMGREKSATLSHGYLMESDGRLAGYGKQVTEQMAAGYLALIKLADVIFGEWGTIELLTGREALSPTGGYRVEIYDMFDVALRYPGAVSFTNALS